MSPTKQAKSQWQ